MTGNSNIYGKNMTDIDMTGKLAVNLCVFCCKSANDNPDKKEEEYDADEEIKRDANINRFFTMTDRQFGSVKFKRVLKRVREGRVSSKVCFDCFEIIEYYCTLYHQLKELELRLNYQLEKLRNVMRFADRVPSRVKAFREWSVGVQDENPLTHDNQTPSKKRDYHSFAHFRRIFKKQCKINHSKEYPRVCISSDSVWTKAEVRDDTYTDEPTNARPSNFTAELTSSQSQEVLLLIVEDEDTEVSPPSGADKEQIKYYSLGWIVSFATIIFLHYLEIKKDIRPVPESNFEQISRKATEDAATMTINEEVTVAREEDETFEGMDVTSMISEDSSHSGMSGVDNDNNFTDAEVSADEGEEDPGIRLENQEESINDTTDDMRAADSFAVAGTSTSNRFINSRKYLNVDEPISHQRENHMQYQVPITVSLHPNFQEFENPPEPASSIHQNLSQNIVNPTIIVPMEMGSKLSNIPTTDISIAELEPEVPHSEQVISMVTSTLVPSTCASSSAPSESTLTQSDEAPVSLPHHMTSNCIRTPIAPDTLIPSTVSNTRSIPPEPDILSVPTRRSMRQVFQCFTCKATFSNSERLETHITSAHCDSKMEISETDDENDGGIGGDNAIDADEDWCMEGETSIRERNDNPESANIKSESDSKSEEENEEDQDEDEEGGSPSEAEPESEDEIKPRRVTKPGTGTHRCSECTPSVSFRSERSLRVHSKFLHSNGKMKIHSSHVQRSDIQNGLKLENYSGPTHRCLEEQCPRSYNFHEELQHHMKLCHDSTNIKCHICNLSQPNLLDLIRHELKHTNSQQQEANEDFIPGSNYYCARCNVFTANKTCFINHYLETHLEMAPIQATCPICKKIFINKEQVPFVHYINYHDLRRLGNRTQPFRCLVNDCPAYFLTEEQLHVHQNRIHTGIDSSMTLEGNINKIEMAKRTRKWRNPSKQAALSKKFVCSKCSQSFRTSSSLRSHVLLAHKHYKGCSMKTGLIVISTPEEALTVNDVVSNRNAKYFCHVDQCKKGFMEEVDLESHSKLHGEFKCNFCDVVKTFALDLAVHELVHGSRGTGADKATRSARFRCVRCSFSTPRKHEFIEHHVEKHLGLTTDKLRCPICKHAYPLHNTNEDAIKRIIIDHFVTCHDLSECGPTDGESIAKAYKCERENCVAYFRSAIQLHQHVLRMHDNISRSEQYKCEDCGKCFNRSLFLRDHRFRRHKVSAADFQFVCDVPECEERFERQLELQYHINHCHTGAGNTVKEFVCPEENCGKKFWTPSGLNSHLRGMAHKKDKDKKSYVCDECGKGFKGKSLLDIHMTFHQKPESWEFSCSVCNKKIVTKQKLGEHMRTHTKEKPFICQVCGSKYAHRHNFNHHMKSKHDMDVGIRKIANTSNFASTRKGKKLKDVLDEEEDST